MPRKLTQAERRAQSRRKLLRAAIDVVARHGFHGASVDAIAKRAGYSTGALYSNFKSKDDLFFAVFDEHVAWFEENLAGAFGRPDLTEAAEAWLDLVTARPEQFLIFIEFWAYAVRRPRVRPRFAERMAQMRGAVAAAVRARAETHGRSPTVDPDLAALMAVAGGRGLALEKVANAEAFDERAVLGVLTSLIG